MTEPETPPPVTEVPKTSPLSLATSQFIFTVGLALVFGVPAVLPAEIPLVVRLLIGILATVVGMSLSARFPRAPRQFVGLLIKPRFIIPVIVLLIVAVVLILTLPWLSEEFRRRTALTGIFFLSIGIANLVRLWIKFAETPAPVTTRLLVAVSLVNSLVLSFIPVVSFSYSDTKAFSVAGAVLVALGINEIVVLIMGVLRVRDERRAKLAE